MGATMVFGGGAVATADEPTTQEAVAHALQRVPAPAEPPANIAPVEVEVDAADAEGSVQLPNGRDVTVTAADVDGSVVKERADGVQVLTVLKHGDSAADFQIGLPIGIVLTRVGEGYEITDPSGHVVYGQIAKPWAIDAQGKRLATRYELHGATIVQKVNTTGAAFPVVADPYIQRSWWGVTVKFTKRETLTMATGAGAVAWIATSIPDSTVSKIIAVAAGGIALHATIARAYGKCVAVKKPWYGPLIPWYWSC